MIEINNYKLPSKWEEFSPEEFLTVARYVSLFTEGAFSVKQTKIHLFCALTNFRIERLKPNQRQKFTDNLLKLLKNFNFFYEIIYSPAGKFKNISPEVRQLLRKQEPEKIEEPEARFAEKLKRSYAPDLLIRRQLLPELRVSRRQKLKGYLFDCCRIPETNITAEQFIDANQAYEAFEESRDPAYLDLLTAILYCHPYSSDKARALVEQVESVSIEFKNAALLNYLGILNYLFRETQYSVLFSQSGSKTKKKNRLGMSAILFSMSEKGYGSLQEVAGLNLFTFLDLIYKNISDAISECLSLEMSKDEISEKLDIPIHIINEFA